MPELFLECGIILLSALLSSAASASGPRCQILVPKVSDKNQKAMTEALRKKGYEVRETELVSALVINEDDDRTQVIVDATAGLPPGTLYLEIDGKVRVGDTLVGDTLRGVTQSHLKVALSNGSSKNLGESNYHMWVPRLRLYWTDPQLFDVSDLPRCTPQLEQEVAAAKASALNEIGTTLLPRPKALGSLPVSDSMRKDLADPAQGFSAPSDNSTSAMGR